MSYRRSKSTQSERGAALVLAMLVFALVAALMVGLQRDFTLTLQRGTHQLFSEQAWAYLIGAEELAAVALQADSRADAGAEVATDHLGELWAQPPTPYPLDAGGWMSGRIEDLQGRLNLNLLADSQSGGSTTPDASDAADAEDTAEELAADNPRQQTGTTPSDDPTKRWNATQKMFIRLLQALGEASLSLEEAMALTDAVTDFIDRDAERRLSGAEEGDYRYADYPYLPANRALASVSELAHAGQCPVGGEIGVVSVAVIAFLGATQSTLGIAINKVRNRIGQGHRLFQRQRRLPQRLQQSDEHFLRRVPALGGVVGRSRPSLLSRIVSG